MTRNETIIQLTKLVLASAIIGLLAQISYQLTLIINLL